MIIATLKEVSHGNEKYCFELSIPIGDSKGFKKFLFATENESDRRRWVDGIMRTKSSLQTSSYITLQDGSKAYSTVNPILSHNNATVSYSGSLTSSQSSEQRGTSLMSVVSLTTTPLEMSGYLLKKSPSAMRGFQRRYFVLRSPGELAYYMKVIKTAF